ncbi:hypothetical protein EHS25_002367 [Saitozyma podzolica]|uniref:Uncharacterized protein n=1 Tax=Saitozyma podzolica TaxID=1890683 RepID=A0A427YDM4_9TREE|nr:hypothetical protein EHS25_002367 [Saitozyma podzolica]
MDIRSLFDVKDRVVLVTGGGRGVGEMVSVQCARPQSSRDVTSGDESLTPNRSQQDTWPMARRARAQLDGTESSSRHDREQVYISSRDVSACNDTASRLTKQGPGRCFSLPADLSRYDECERLVKEIAKREEVLHVLVNNSGVTWGESIDTYPDSAWTKLLTLNVQRVFTLTQKLLPLLEKGGTRDGVGRVINIGSINGVSVPGMETFAYSASKAALHQCVVSLLVSLSSPSSSSVSPRPLSAPPLHYPTTDPRNPRNPRNSRRLSRHLASRVGPSITVNTLALGPFRSKMMRATLDSFEQEIAQGLPLERIGKPEDVAAACLWLSGKGGEWVTGTVVPVDGGSLVGPKARL